MLIQRYRELKALGLINISLEEDTQAIVFSKRRFSPETGEELLPEKQSVSKTIIDKCEAKILNDLEEIREIRKDYDVAASEKIG